MFKEAFAKFIENWLGPIATALSIALLVFVVFTMTNHVSDKEHEHELAMAKLGYVEAPAVNAHYVFMPRYCNIDYDAE